MSTPSSNQYFEAIHTGPGTPTDPNLFSASEIVAGSFDSAAVSTATSKAVSTINAAAPDSTSISQARSQAVSAASVGSVADSKAVSDSVLISAVDSRATSNSVNTSVADSKAVSVATATPTVTAVVYSGNISAADSKAVSIATASDLPARVPAGGRTVTTLTAHLNNNVLFNPKDWGALCDGTTDDTAAWLDMISDMGDTSTMRHAKIRLPGPSVISSTLTFDRKSVEFFGSGMGSTSAGQGSALIWYGPDNVPMVKFKRSWMVSLHHLHFVNQHAINKPSAAIDINVTTGDSPIPTRFGLSHITIGGTSFDSANQNSFRSGIVTSGDNLQCDQSSIDNLMIQSCTDYGIRLLNSQNVFWKIEDATINCGTTAKGISTAARYITLKSVFFQTNGTDIELVGDVSVEAENIGSELSGKFVLATTAGQFQCRGGYWQYNSANQNADGKIIDMQGGVYLELNHFNFTNRATQALTQTIWLRGADVMARFVGTPYVGASWTAFLDVATATAGDKRRIEVEGLSAGNFVNEWIRGDTFSVVDSLRYDLSPSVRFKQDDWQVPALQNSWANFGGGFSTWGVYKDKNSQVWLRGFISGGTTTDGTLIATLPAGYRPAFKTPVMAYNNASATPQRYQITTAGAISLDGAAAGAISLDGISFRAA